PVAVPPFMTRPSTSKEPSPVSRLILALPFLVVHGPAPLWIWLTGLSTPGAVITPSIPRQRTTVSVWANAPAHSANDNKRTFFMRIVLSFSCFDFDAGSDRAAGHNPLDGATQGTTVRRL